MQNGCINPANYVSLARAEQAEHGDTLITGSSLLEEWVPSFTWAVARVLLSLPTNLVCQHWLLTIT